MSNVYGCTYLYSKEFLKIECDSKNSYTPFYKYIIIFNLLLCGTWRLKQIVCACYRGSLRLLYKANMNIVSRRLFGRQLMSRLRLCCRSSCLPLLSLTKTPRGGNLEWMAACCDPFFDYCERSVWLIGMVS